MSRFDARVQTLRGKGCGAKPRTMCRAGLHDMSKTRVSDGETTRCNECIRDRKKRHYEKKKAAAHAPPAQ
jgi:hypothetical protein